ncbi:uncharacterized protein LOC144624942 isoform X2 [Crassostrea virginica]
MGQKGIVLFIFIIVFSETESLQKKTIVSESRNYYDVFTLMEHVFAMKPKIAKLEEKVNFQKKQIEALQSRDSGILGYYRWPTQTWPYIKRVNFQSPFKQPPKLTYGFYFLDSSHTKNLRVVAKTSKVTNTGFQVIMNPWHDTVLYGAKISWMACGY